MVLPVSLLAHISLFSSFQLSNSPTFREETTPDFCDIYKYNTVNWGLLFSSPYLLTEYNI